MIVLRYLFTAWAFLLFIAFILVGIVVYFFLSIFKRQHAQRGYMAYNRFWMRSWAFLCGVRLKVVPNPLIDPNRQYIFAPNHTSLGDVVMGPAAFGGACTALGKIELKKIPLMGYLFAKSCILVDRNDPESRRKSIEQMRQIGKDNISVVVFPEGTRNASGFPPLLDFHSGAFRIAIDLQIPLVPSAIIGARNLMPNEKPPLYPCQITCMYANPIDTAGLTHDDLPWLSNKTYNAILQLLAEHDPLYAPQKEQILAQYHKKNDKPPIK
ncbi:MAG: 1-acyl-sn-glycerol-3-phosphate acyltransferase [Sphingobacteriales bacterium]|jgi:1-acyl-sn-glycerol-3-phosphate acyltransferase|nr:1-acyl-sn-glycerol-3-phosphate acyltransferase [Sphingobacteriales bacterium]MBP9141462.1 1-acyl-sn-glycerol-3-phosphate acyltransferase [Chitinophagales bacterium]MDA0198440.1 lysophospholipid acyltransferase family protein [Bacteroidota bacterium]MBK6890901.1 1-acyl-sn-glycerol-3-phosphate acyltransferase [Sphingobacteriales bacterium]MBK7526047.1 1-acyl-sn-glycerol-3-phosphate acyltransferase [Sphingobacteriales bacterium]